MLGKILKTTLICLKSISSKLHIHIHGHIDKGHTKKPTSEQLCMA